MIYRVDTSQKGWLLKIAETTYSVRLLPPTFFHQRAPSISGLSQKEIYAPSVGGLTTDAPARPVSPVARSNAIS